MIAIYEGELIVLVSPTRFRRLNLIRDGTAVWDLA